tara:strand:- start:8682 stop:8963 length:282 start_codon:yes stop_codon:yes gene_type:complete
MTVSEIMERAGIKETGRAIVYIKEALQEMAIEAPTHHKVIRMDIINNKRFYNLPSNAEEITDIRCKNHNNSSSEYRSIPRSIYEPFTKDSDGI